MPPLTGTFNFSDYLPFYFTIETNQDRGKTLSAYIPVSPCSLCLANRMPHMMMERDFVKYASEKIKL